MNDNTDTFLVILLGCLVCLCIYLTKVNIQTSIFQGNLVDEYKKLSVRVTVLEGYHD